MLKKLLSTILCITMVSGMLMGCSGTGAETAGAASESKAESSTGDEGERIKIGVSIWNTSNGLAASSKKMLDYAAEALGCDIEYVATNLETDLVISSVENLVASGCDAIIVCNSADGQMPQLLNIAQSSGVYLAQMFRTITDEDVAKLLNESDYFVGRTCEDEYQTGYNLGTIMAEEKGVTNVGVISYNRGDLTAENRYAGFAAAFAENGVNIVAEQWEVKTSEEGATTTNNFMAAYPEMDGLVVVGGTEQLVGAINSIENAGKSDDIALTTIDFNVSTKENLEKEQLDAIAGGHFTDPLFSLLMCYNAVTGHLTADDFPLEVNNPMIYIASADDYEQYEVWFEGDELPFNEEEIKNLTGQYNEDFTFEMIQEAAANLSVEDVKSRHQ